MYECFKEKVKTHQNKLNNPQKPHTPPSKTITETKQPPTTTKPYKENRLKQLFPEELDKEGCDLSLMSSVEIEIMTLCGQTKQYLTERYPQTQQEAKLYGSVWVEEPQTPLQIDTAKAIADPKGKTFLELILKMKTIYDKLFLLQTQATEYEKICLRFYGRVTYLWHHDKDCEMFRGLFLDYKNDLFELVETYFKICKKYQVPTLEEPYYFLTEEQQLEVKLEGDMLKRTGKYSDFEIHLSILETFT